MSLFVSLIPEEEQDPILQEYLHALEEFKDEELIEEEPSPATGGMFVSQESYTGAKVLGGIGFLLTMGGIAIASYTAAEKIRSKTIKNLPEMTDTDIKVVVSRKLLNRDVVMEALANIHKIQRTVIHSANNFDKMDAESFGKKMQEYGLSLRSDLATNLINVGSPSVAYTMLGSSALVFLIVGDILVSGIYLIPIPIIIGLREYAKRKLKLHLPLYQRGWTSLDHYRLAAKQLDVAYDNIKQVTAAAASLKNRIKNDTSLDVDKKKLLRSMNRAVRISSGTAIAIGIGLTSAIKQLSA